MRVKASLSVSLLFLSMVAVPAFSQGSEAGAVNTTQVVAWLTAGVSGARLARLVSERGLATLPTNRELRQVECCGSQKDLLRVLSSGNVQSAQIGPAIPAALLRAAVRPASRNSMKLKMIFGEWSPPIRIIPRYISPWERCCGSRAVRRRL